MCPLLLSIQEAPHKVDIQGNSKVVTLKVVTPPSQVVTLGNNQVKVVTQDNNPLLLGSQPQVSTRTLLKDKPDMARLQQEVWLQPHLGWET